MGLRILLCVSFEVELDLPKAVLLCFLRSSMTLNPFPSWIATFLICPSELREGYGGGTESLPVLRSPYRALLSIIKCNYSNRHIA